jgi:hypothetical protein
MPLMIFVLQVYVHEGDIDATAIKKVLSDFNTNALKTRALGQH